MRYCEVEGPGMRSFSIDVSRLLVQLCHWIDVSRLIVPRSGT